MTSTALPFSVGRYGRHTHTPEGIAMMATPLDVQHGAASGVSLGIEQKGVPSRHVLGPPMLPVDGKWPQPEPVWPRSVYDVMGISPEEVPSQVATKPGPATTAMLTQSEISRSSGYTGDSCPDCGNFTMKRNGACLSCTTCGGTTGCS